MRILCSKCMISRELRTPVYYSLQQYLYIAKNSFMLERRSVLGLRILMSHLSAGVYLHYRELHCHSAVAVHVNWENNRVKQVIRLKIFLSRDCEILLYKFHFVFLLLWENEKSDFYLLIAIFIAICYFVYLSTRN